MSAIPLLLMLYAVAILALGNGHPMCPRPIGENFISNGGFDDSNTTVSPWQLLESEPLNSNTTPPYAAIVHPGYQSQNAFRIGPSNGSSYASSSELRQIIHDCPKDVNLASLYYKAVCPSLPCLPGVYLETDDVNDFYYPSITKETNNTWQLYELYFYRAGQVLLTASLQQAPNQTYLYLDEVQASHQGPFRAKRDAKNAFANPGFESGKLGPWKAEDVYEGCSLSSPGENSSYAYHCAFPAGNDFFSASLTQTVKSKPGTHYLVEYDYRYVRTTKSICGIYHDFGGTENFIRYGIYTPVKSKGWNHQESPYVARGHNLTLTFTLYVRDAETPCNLTVDNFSVKEMASQG